MIATDLSFPAGLPCPLREGYGINHVQPFSRTPMASGRSRQRRQFTSVPSMVKVAWLFRSNQAARFEAWFRDTIHDGVDWFNCDLKTPLGYESYVCRFTEMYEGPLPVATDSWRVSAVLELWERPLVPRDWNALLPDYILGSDIFDRAMNQRWPEA